MTSEKELLQSYVEARREVGQLSVQLSDAKERMNQAEAALLKFMEDNGVVSTAKYDGLGRLTITAPMLRVSIAEGKESDAFAYLKLIGEDSSIKQSIHWKRLASIIQPKVENNEPLPEAFTYFFQQQTRFEEA